MKRWLLWIAVVAIAVTLGAVVRSHLRLEARKGREAAYQSALQSYSENLQPGLTRKAVEDYLRARKISFSYMCCMGQEYYVDRVKLGEESAPWYCEEANVYVAFEFAAVDPHDPRTATHFARDSDVLRKIEIDRPVEGCL
jgi:hypothetical protein